MVTFNCGGKINVVRTWGDYIGVGCSDGWIYLFKGEELLWENKLSATYYRDPYNDVGVLSMDICENFIVVGTNFMDGKVYAISFDGDVLWYKQFLTIVGCWERPDDVVAVAIGDDKIAVGTEWVNSYVHQLDFSGNNISTFKVDGYITGIVFWKDFVIGTDRALYFGRKRERLNVRGLVPLGNFLVVSSDSGIYTINGGVKKIYESTPLFAVSRERIILYDKELIALSWDGEILWSCEVERPIKILCDGGIYLGYSNLVKIVENGEITEEIEVEGVPVELAENFIVSVRERKLHISKIP